jgi:uncharacterized protein (DUF433 family)
VGKWLAIFSYLSISPGRVQCNVRFYIRKEEKMPIDWREHIVSTTDVLHGKPRIKGTRIPVSLILGYLAAGQTAEEILADFSDLRKEHIAACLDYARALAEFEVAV